ncbi:hypothetical protein ACFLSQ_01100 [Bacteroidota bacterium]
MPNSIIKYLFIMIVFFISQNILHSQQSDVKEDEEYYEDEYEYEEIDWKYLFFDIGYGGSGPGAALGFRYWHLGASIGVTGFANDIPNTSPRIPQGVNISELPKKVYPSNSVSGDFWGFYELEKFTLFANLGFFSSIDSVLRYDSENQLYYRDTFKKSSGMTWGFGAQIPLTFIDEENLLLDQLVGGVGYHSQIGIFLRIAYRWE